MKAQKGFTLIELLVVIAIVAILSVVVILTLNPAELLRQARDSNRVSDLATIKSALSLYLADVKTPELARGSSGNCFVSAATTTGMTQCGVFSADYGTGSSSAVASRTVDGTGWLPVNFNQISSGSPLPQLPVDPVNNTTTYYAYAASTTNLNFEIDAKMESTKYSTGTNNITYQDGGDQPTWYEVGTNLSM